MKKLVNLSGIAVLAFLLFTSCEKSDTYYLGTENIALKSVENPDGKMVSRYIYNTQGQLTETEDLYYYNRYVYNSDGRLEKTESAVSSQLTSSLVSDPQNLMTAQNTTISKNDKYYYDATGKLLKSEYYQKANGNFELISYQTFEYSGNQVSKKNIHRTDGQIAHFHAYTYDARGNVKNEKYYSYILPSTATPKLISETNFTYDNNRNPYMIYKMLGQPGLYTNSNNILESEFTLYQDVPASPVITKNLNLYTYNPDNFPVKVTSANTFYQYNY